MNNKKDVVIQNCIWRTTLDVQKKYSAQIRYHGEYKSCMIQQQKNNCAVIEFEMYDYSLSPGQSIVVYDDSVCIGGGIVM